MKETLNISQNLPKGWRRVKLGEIADFQNGYAFSSREFISKKEDAVPVFKMGNIKEGGGIQWTGKEDYVPRKKAQELSHFMTGPGDILMCMTDMKANVRLLGYSAYIKNEKFLINQRVGRIKAKKGLVAPRFLYFYLNSPIYIAYIRSTARSGVQVNLTTEEIKQSPISLPSFSEQKRIADILSAFDDKIEVNNKISKTLEQMAQAIFKEWFVNFRFPGHEKVKMVDSELGKIPEGWEVKMLPEVFDFLEGPGIRNWQYTSKGCHFINIRLIQNNDIDIKSANFISEEEANGKYKHFHLQERDMVVSTSGTLGRTAIVRKEHLPLLLNTSVIRFRPRDGRSYAFMYQFLKSAYFQNKVLSMASGSAQPNFGPVHLKQIEIIVPDKETLNAFNKAVSPIYEKIINNMSENQKLTALRDLLLPKLMSGEVMV